MKKIEIEKEHMLTRDGLHDLMISFNAKSKKQIDRDKLSKAIYDFIDDLTDENTKVMRSSNNIEVEMYIQKYFISALIFKYTNGNYIYWIKDVNNSDEVNYSNKVEFLKCLLDNYKNFNEDKLNEQLKRAKSDLDYIIKSNEVIEANKDPIGILKKSFRNYDYVKILKNYLAIGYYDVISCKEYLEKSEDIQNDFNLTIDEKMCLYLIILYGLKNIYFYYSKLYKYSLKKYNDCIENMDIFINLIEENKNKVSKEKIYSKEENYYEYIILENILSQFELQHNKDSEYIIRRYINGEYLKEPLQLIYFDYLISNNKFKEARKYINENSIYLYLNLEKTISIEVNTDEIVNSLIHEVVDDYKMRKYDTTFCDVTLNDLLLDEEYKNKYVIPVLKFIINYLYLLKSEGKENQVDCLYSFLKIFEKGFGIEDFFVKFNYELLFSKLKKINKLDEDADIDNIDSVIDEMSNTIEEANLIDKRDIEKVEKMYPHINFKNLDFKVRNYIATGDTIMLVFNDSNNIDFDYSSAVIEWSKAVELEAWEKLINIDKVKKNAQKIRNEIDPNKYIKREKDKRDLKPDEVTNFKFKSNIGTFDAIEIRFMKDGRKMRKYLYDEYYSELYYFDEITYNELIDNILLVYDPRNKSAHKDNTIDLDEAKACQTVVVAANKILEVLSNLKRKDNNKI